MIEPLKQLYKSRLGVEPQSITPVSAQGSSRRYYRLIADDQSVIGVQSDNIAENRAFVYFSNLLYQSGINVPQVYGVSNDFTCYIQQDLGDKSLFDAIASGREKGEFDNEERQLLRLTMQSLADIQYKGAINADFSNSYPQVKFDRRSIMWDLDYFKYCYLKNVVEDIDEPALENEFERLTDTLLDYADSDTLLYRDFQSRNVMIKDGAPWFIDFQGARQGPPHYDVASFLWQARANFNDSIRNELIDVYLQSATRYIDCDKKSFTETLQFFVLFRQLQTLGAYGFRGLTQKKDHFIKSLPKAIENTIETLDKSTRLGSLFPYIHSVLKSVRSDESPKLFPEGKLTITIGSFSYKKSLPQDHSGNGGGFVFDCRGMHNPGRYNQYKKLTGRDKPVMDFLEDRGEVTDFVSKTFDIVKNSIDTYLRRGFTSLSIWFGCTGGQHRSVYCADALSKLIANKYPQVIINLIHREQAQLNTTK